MRKILNLTQHPATPEQVAAGVVEPSTDEKKRIKSLLTFESIPSWKLLNSNAIALRSIVEELGFKETMIGGAPFFMSHLEGELRRGQIVVRYAFSKRESVEVTQPDGSVKKTMVFKHLGFFSVPEDE